MRPLSILWIVLLVTQPRVAIAAACSVERSVKKIVAEEYGKTPGQVSPGDKVAVDGPHTIEDTEIQQMTEEKFNIKISDAAWSKISSVADLTDYVKAHAANCR